MADTLKARPRRRWFGRWLLKLALWFVTLSAVVLGIVAVVALVAYWNLTGLANFALSNFTDPYRVELGRVDVGERGLIRLEEVRIRPPKDFETAGGVPWVTLAGVDLGYEWNELRRERRFRSIVLRHPVIHIDDTSLEVLGLAGKRDEDGDGKTGEIAPSFDLRSLGRVTDRIEVVSGSLVVDTARAPRLEAAWDASIPAIDFSGADWLNADPLTLRFSAIKIGRNGEGGSIDRVALAGRIRSDLGGVEVARLGIEQPRLKVTPAWFPAGKAEGEPPVAKPPTGEAFQILLGVFEVRGGVLEVAGFENVPDIGLKSEIDWRDLTIEGGNIRAGAPLTLAVSEVKVGALARAEKVTALFDPAALIGRRRVESIALELPRLTISPATLPGKADAAAGAKEAGAPRSDWEIGAATVRDGTVEVRDWFAGGRAMPAVTVAGVDMDLVGLSAAGFAGETGPGGGDAVQSVRTGGIVVGEAKSGPLAEVESIAARFRFGSLLVEHRLDALAIEKPVLQLTDETLSPWMLGGDTEEEAAESEYGVVWTVDDLSVSGGDLRLDTRGMGGRLPKLEGGFSIAKAGGEGAGEDLLYRLQFQRLSVRQQAQAVAPPTTPEVPAPTPTPVKLGGLFPGDEIGPKKAKPTGAKSIGDQDVALLRELNIDFTAAGVQRDRRIERIEVKGGELQVGDALRGLVDDAGAKVENGADTGKGAPLQQSPQPRPEAAKAAPGKVADGKKAWSIGELSVTETQVRFQALIPEIEGLEFAIETKLRDVPLSHGGMLAQEARQKVEIAGIEIRDPYDGFITVATLPTIFVEFSLAGLLSQRIEKIDLINPSLHVGQGMFWWIEYQRKHRQRNEGTAFTGAGAAPVAAGDAAAGNNWEINEINAHFGKIVLAPAGRPIGVVPFPFSASTNLNKGEISLKLQIPKEQQYVYRFPDLKLDLYGLEGNVEFNVPIKQESNNLVQTFTLDRAVWKQHEARKLFLTVTYDQNGVYGRFGGDAYGGYAEGQFNAYLGDVGKWDGWIAGTNMDMGPITRVLAPENFLMEGKIDGKLISQGKGLVFGETRGELRTLSPGRIDVTKVKELIEGLPDEWSGLKRSATQLGLETIKDFEYETGTGDLNFVNRDGWLKLDLRGPGGSRVLEAYAHDWRGKGDQRSIEEKLSDFKTEGPKPEKEATPVAGEETVRSPKIGAAPTQPEKPAARGFRGRR